MRRLTSESHEVCGRKVVPSAGLFTVHWRPCGRPSTTGRGGDVAPSPSTSQSCLPFGTWTIRLLQKAQIYKLLETGDGLVIRVLGRPSKSPRGAATGEATLGCGPHFR